MNLAYTMAAGRGDTDLLLHGVAERLSAKGFRSAGIAQIKTERAIAGPCDMDVIVLPDGPTIRISQVLGRSARGTRLDPDALERAVGLVQEQLSECDCFIVNKFGKHEAEGRGFRPLISAALALERGTCSGQAERPQPGGFFAFIGGLAQRFEPAGDVLHR